MSQRTTKPTIRFVNLLCTLSLHNKAVNLLCTLCLLCVCMMSQRTAKPTIRLSIYFALSLCIMCQRTTKSAIRFVNLLCTLSLHNEPAHDKTYDKTCSTSKYSDQPARPRSLIRVFADRMRLSKPLGYQKQDEQEPLLSLLVTQVLL